MLSKNGFVRFGTYIGALGPYILQRDRCQEIEIFLPLRRWRIYESTFNWEEKAIGYVFLFLVFFFSPKRTTEGEKMSSLNVLNSF